MIAASPWSGTRLYDAVVVGAGPAGSATAALLARAGCTVLLLDRAAFPRDKACGEYTSPQTEQVLKRLGVLEAVELAGARRLRAMRVVSPSGNVFSMDYGRPGQDGGPAVLATPRNVLDALLVDHARRCGAEVRERAKVEALTIRHGRVAGVAVREAAHEAREVQARLVIGADGIHSAVVRSLGLTAPLRFPRSLGMVAHYAGYNGLEGWGEMHVSSHGYVGLAPLSGGLLNVGLVIPMRSGQGRNAGPPYSFDALVSSFPGVAARLEGAARVSRVRGVGPIGARVKRTSGEGYMLVGDAAGFFDPFTGEGVYKALRGAELAAEVAIDALARDDLSARSLARYSALRRKEFGAKDLVCRMVQLFVAWPRAMDYVASRLSARPTSLGVLTGVLGDLTEARAALSPVYLWSILRP